jgi:phage protein D
MRNQGICVVFIEGVNIMLTLRRVLQRVNVTDRAGTSSDTATLMIDDKDGLVAFPRHNAKITIYMGFRELGVAQVFSGTIDEVRSTGGRSGTYIEVSAKGLDTSGKAKEPQQRHFDNMTIEAMIRAAGAHAGITDIRIDPDIGTITRNYEHMDDESFIAFGERLARELGGTFKIRNDAAIMVRKNANKAPSGDTLPPIVAARGENLHSWDITPYIGRARYKEIRVRYYDRDQARHDEVVVETEIEGSRAIAVGRFEAPNRQTAEEMANALKSESERGSGVGKIIIEGNAAAQPEAACILTGARISVTGAYVISGVEHTYSRSSGFVTKLHLAHPL